MTCGRRARADDEVRQSLRTSRPRLAAERDDRNDRNDEIRSLTFGAYPTGHWLHVKQLELATSTSRSYVHKTQRHAISTNHASSR